MVGGDRFLEFEQILRVEESLAFVVAEGIGGRGVLVGWGCRWAEGVLGGCHVRANPLSSVAGLRAPTYPCTQVQYLFEGHQPDVQRPILSVLVGGGRGV